MANRVWVAISLFAIVLQLVVIRGFDIRAMLLFCGPVVVALFLTAREPATRGAVLARVFLSLIGLGLVVAKVPWLFPRLGGMAAGLPPASDRALVWYLSLIHISEPTRPY